MSFVTLTAEVVDAIHDEVLNPGELAGRAKDKSLDGALARVENRVAYGMIDDVFDLGAMYAVAIAQGHCFNDANKRTAFRSMNACLALNGVAASWTVEEIGPIIVAVAQGQRDAEWLAGWLRGRAVGG